MFTFDHPEDTSEEITYSGGLGCHGLTLIIKFYTVTTHVFLQKSGNSSKLLFVNILIIKLYQIVNNLFFN